MILLLSSVKRPTSRTEKSRTRTPSRLCGNRRPPTGWTLFIGGRREDHSAMVDVTLASHAKASCDARALSPGPALSDPVDALQSAWAVSMHTRLSATCPWRYSLSALLAAATASACTPVRARCGTRCSPQTSLRAGGLPPGLLALDPLRGAWSGRLGPSTLGRLRRTDLSVRLTRCAVQRQGSCT
jgi:hypothetical protein